VVRKWTSREDLALLEKAVFALRDTGRLEPGMGIPGDPVDLRGLTFPTVALCEQLALPTMVARRVVGKQDFRRAVLSRVDLSRARLDFSVWNECVFEKAVFDFGSLRNVRFFGCQLNECSFRSVDLRDASFSIGAAGRETEICNCDFVRCDFRGVSCDSPVLRRARFVECKLKGFVFDGALCDGVVFVGHYPELLFRGTHGDAERNRLGVDLLRAKVKWFDADRGLDLTHVVPPADRSCFVILDRIRAVGLIAARLAERGTTVDRQVADCLKAIYSDQSISPKDADQSMFMVSRAMLQDIMDTTDERMVEQMFLRIRGIAAEYGVLHAPS
jgi:uncharacterized protein YjbI with pentapeptide repeats